jgi:hypothetical protein
MSLIFDRFPNVEQARRFLEAARELEPELETALYLTAAESQAADPFPYALEPPIVHLSRIEAPPEDLEGVEIGGAVWELIHAPYWERELELENLAADYAGVFAGT